MNKDNCIKAIKWEDIEIPVEYLKQTTVNISGDDYIRLQQENKQLKDNWNKLKEYINRYIKYDKNRRISKCLSAITIMNKMQKLEQGSDSK